MTIICHIYSNEYYILFQTVALYNLEQRHVFHTKCIIWLSRLIKAAKEMMLQNK